MNLRIKLTVVLISFLICGLDSNSQESAQGIIDKTIEVSGGDNYHNYIMEFDFRHKHYVSKRNNGVFEYARIVKDNGKKVIASYGNMKPFLLTINGEQKDISKEKAKSIQNSINSVNYFALLPYGLNDKAVFKTYKGVNIIKGTKYYTIEVKFSEDGGGKDFEDVYLYWINTTTYKVDYLAYSYLVDGGGVRFREAYNERYVNGLRFVDYNNYKSNDKSIELSELPQLFMDEQLKLLSKIELENISVN